MNNQDRYESAKRETDKGAKHSIDNARRAVNAYWELLPGLHQDKDALSWERCVVDEHLHFLRVQIDAERAAASDRLAELEKRVAEEEADWKLECDRAIRHEARIAEVEKERDEMRRIYNSLGVELKRIPGSEGISQVIDLTKQRDAAISRRDEDRAQWERERDQFAAINKRLEERLAASDRQNAELAKGTENLVRQLAEAQKR